MRIFRNLGAFVFLAALAVTGSLPGRPAQTAAQLKPGDPAPPFSLLGSDGRTYRLADIRGKQVVVLVWFVKAFSGG
jgi:cytochrome oxidase Cu insertion factor (SCO1/SenC/PrrC family)